MGVTLASNINHSVHAARALAGMGVLERYLGPVVLDPGQPLAALAPRRLRQARSFAGVRTLPLSRLLIPEAVARVRARSAMSASERARRNAATLDAAVLRRLGRPTVFHFHTAALTRSVAAAKARGALLIADHRDVHPRAHDYADPLLEGLEAEFRAADWVLVNSAFAAESLGHFGVPVEKVVVLPLGVDLDAWSPGREGRRRTPGEPLRLLFVGSGIRRKGLDVLLDALGVASLRSATLRVAGPLTDRELADRCESHPLVETLGPLLPPRLLEEYRQADVLVLPSRRDAFGLVAVEALACGTPVVVTDQCGVASLVRDHGAGAVATAGDALDLADRLADLSARLQAGERLGDRARRAARQCSWTAYQERLATWYREAVLPSLATPQARERVP